MRVGALLLAAVAACGMAADARAASLTLRADYRWFDPSPDFGGLSGLIMAPDGASLRAISDDGVLFEAAVLRDGQGIVTAITPGTTLRLHDNRDRSVAGFNANAEALTPDPGPGAGQRIFVAFEGYSRISAFDLPNPKPHPAHPWRLFEPLWGNTGFEGLAALPDGRLVAVIERAEQGAYPVWLQQGHNFVAVPGLPAPDDYAATDLALGPDRRLYLLERRQALPLWFQTRIRRFDPVIARDGRPDWGAGETLLETAPGTLDNMEGISLWFDAARDVTVVSLVSDNSFLPVQSTRLVEYDLRG
jgi:hypothetical protein